MSFRAVRVKEFGAPSVLQVEEVPQPELSAGQVLVKLRAVGINPVETYIRSGAYPRLPGFPYTPGSDGAGDVEQVAEDVTEWKVGDRVYLSGSVTGTYAEKAVALASQLHRLPDRVSYAQGAAIYVPYATAYYALFIRGRAIPGETVLVHGGSGGVGLAAIQLATARGLKVLGTASAKEGLAAIESFGAKAFCHRDSEYIQQILSETGNKGVDIILEMLANVNLENDISKLVAQFGRTLIIGNRGAIEINPRALMMKNSDVRGVALGNATAAELNEAFHAIDAGLVSGTLNPVIDNSKQFSLDNAPDAHIHVIERPSGIVGKVVLHV